MTSSSDLTLIQAFENASTQINRYLGIAVFIFGSVGNIANIFVLSQRCLRSNPCAWLFLVSSMASLVGILAGVSTRFLFTWVPDVTATNAVISKLRAFILFMVLTMGSWLIGFAALDRWLVSSEEARRRQQSSLKNAQRGFIVVTIFAMITQGHHVICFETNVNNNAVRCFARTLQCRILSDLTFSLIAVVFPLIFMVIFSLLTIVNVRRARSHVQPSHVKRDGSVDIQSAAITDRQHNQRNKIDRQLLIMLLIQVLLTTIFGLPIGIQRIYATITWNVPKSPLQNVIETFTFNLFLLIYYITCGMPFYIYTLSGGTVFRKTSLDVMRAIGRKLNCHRP